MAEAWIECVDCGQWRRVVDLDEKYNAEGAKWHCRDNTDEAHRSCSAPQELSDNEIDERLRAQEARNAATGAVPDPADMAPRAEAAVWRLTHRNFFTHRPPKQVREEDVMMCNCAPGPDGRGCGEDCLNRSLFYECDQRFCPCASGCQNQRFQRREYAHIEMCRAGKKGHGLATSQALCKGQFITEYVGEVLEESVYAKRKAFYAASGQRHFFFMSLSGAEVIDACERGNLGRFVNHSCAPNCETQKWVVNGELCIGLFAIQDITAGSELTFDYNFERYGDKPMRCLCAAKNCRGWVGGKGEGDQPSEEEEEAEAEEPAPVMLASDGRENEAFQKAAAHFMAQEAERAARRERERADRVARRKASEGRAARRASAPGGGGGKARRSGAPAPPPFVKRSEVDRRLDELLSPAGAIKHRDAVRPLLRLFHVALAGEEAAPDAATGPAVSSRDLSLLLEAVLQTQAPSLQRALLECSALSIFNMALPRLLGADVLLPVLRKLLRVLDTLPLSERELRNTRSAHGSLLEALRRLERAPDADVARRAQQLCAKATGGGAPPPRASYGGTPGGGGAPTPGWERGRIPSAGTPYSAYAAPPPPYSADRETAEERAAKRARSFGGTAAESMGGWRAANGALLSPPPPPPRDPPPPPPPPPPERVSMMELAPVGSPTMHPVGDGGDVPPHPRRASEAGPSAPIPTVYSATESVPEPTKTDISRLPEVWDNPHGDAFKVGVLMLVAYRLGKYKQAEHPLARLVRPSADAMAIKLASKVVDRERRKADSSSKQSAGVQRDALGEKIKTFVSEHVHALSRH